MMALRRVNFIATNSFIRGVSCAGLGLTGYLAFIHLALLRGELYGGLICGAAGTLFNCHVVAASRFSQFLGIPLSFWGLIGYLATFTLALIAAQFPASAEDALTLLTGLAAGFLAVDAGLLVIMLTRIHYLCLLCLLTYAVNLLLAISAQQALGRPWPQVIRRFPTAWAALTPGTGRSAALFFWGVVLTGAGGVGAVSAAAQFMSRAAPGSLPGRMAAHVRSADRVRVDTAEDPVLGEGTAPIQVIEFSDFLCPLCQEAAQFDTIVMANHRDEIALHVKQFPLDQTCNSAIDRTLHPGACQLAVAAKCAQEQGKFWAFRDRIFQFGPRYRLENLDDDAARIGLDVAQFRECVVSGRGLEAVKKDVQIGARIGISVTPSYVINGMRIRGSLPPAVFEELLQALRETAGGDLANGPVSRQNVGLSKDKKEG